MRATTDGDAGGHASFVASIIAGEKNNQGSHGVAFGASILSIRADRPGSCQDTSTDGGCKFDDATLARGIDYAIAQGAKIINLSLGWRGRWGFAPSRTLCAVLRLPAFWW